MSAVNRLLCLGSEGGYVQTIEVSLFLLPTGWGYGCRDLDLRDSPVSRDVKVAWRGHTRTYTISTPFSEKCRFERSTWPDTPASKMACSPLCVWCILSSRVPPVLAAQKITAGVSTLSCHSIREDLSTRYNRILKRRRPEMVEDNPLSPADSREGLVRGSLMVQQDGSLTRR